MKLLLYIFIFLIIGIKSSLSLNTNATNAVVLDYKTNEILFEKLSNELTAPASMTKIMTAYITFDRIKNGWIKLDDIFIVSENAWKKGGELSGSSTMFLKVNQKVTLSDLLRGMIVQSGNDASICIAENISGSEEKFVSLMNEYAENLGMINTNFQNSSGWPDPDHYSTMKDLAILSKSIINDFPELYKIFSETEFTFNIKSPQYNRNRLLKTYEGTDGLKTGYVKNTGYGIAATSVKDGRRIIVVINGLKSSKERTREAETLMNWAYNETKHFTIIEKGQILSSVDTWLGKKNNIDLISSEKILTTLDFEQSQNVTIKLSYNKPLEAPIEKNQEIGKIKIEIPNKELIEIPLISSENVEKINPLLRVFVAIKYLIFGNIYNEE